MNVETEVKDKVFKEQTVENMPFGYWERRLRSYNKLVKLPPKFDQIKNWLNELSDKIDLVDSFPQSLITFYSI